MPSQSNYDELPSYLRVQMLRRMAATVIRSMPRVARPTPASHQRMNPGRPANTERRYRRRVAETRRGSEYQEASKPRERQANRERPALERGPHRTYDGADLSAERLRQQLRGERRLEP